MSNQMQIKQQVRIEGYNAAKRLVIKQTFSTYDWYEELHPMIDEDEEHVRFGVVEIRGWQYDTEGNLTVNWNASYSANGAIRELLNYYNDGTSDFRLWKEYGAQEQIHDEIEQPMAFDF